MKRIVSLLAALALVLGIVGCASTGNTSGSTAPSASPSAASNATPAAAPSEASSASGRNVRGGIPQFVRDALIHAPENALVGIGSAKMATISMSMTISATRGRAEISRQMDSFVRNMVRDYTAASEVDPSAVMAFQENITVALSQSRLQGAAVVDQDIDEAGNCWTVVMLSKTNTVQEINQAVAAAKLAVPAMASFDAERRMNEAFDSMVKDQEVQVVSSGGEN